MFRFIIIGLVTILGLSTVHAAPYKVPLATDKAFNFSVSQPSPNSILAHWIIAPGYYLYRDRISFSFNPDVDADIDLPKGHTMMKADKKAEEVYAGEIQIPILLHTKAESVQLKVNYQGCSERNFCYPPMTKTVTLNLKTPTDEFITPTSHHSLQSLLTDQNGIRDLFDAQSFSVILFIFLGIGLLLAFTPCVLPMIPILTSIILGHQQPVTTRKAFMLSITYVFGASITYAAGGLLAAYLGHSLQVWLQQTWIIVAVSSLFILLSLSLFGIYDLRIPNYWQNRITAISRKQQGGTYVGVFIMGIISTLIVSPCVTAPLIGVLMYIANAGNPLLGASALFVMSLGMGIPLIVIGVSAGKWMPKRGLWMVIVQKLLGILMVFMAIWLLARVASWHTILVYGAAVMIASILYYSVVYRSESHQPILHRLGFISGLIAIFALGATTISKVPVVATSKAIASEDSSSFTVIHSVKDLQQQLDLAKTSNKPVMVDFYADWCESCILMEKKVFTQSKVLRQLSPFILLRVDLSANNANDQALLNQYEVLAPPTVLFFNNQGNEVARHRIVGELDANEFMSRIQTFFIDRCDTKLMC